MPEDIFFDINQSITKFIILFSRIMLPLMLLGLISIILRFILSLVIHDDFKRSRSDLSTTRDSVFKPITPLSQFTAKHEAEIIKVGAKKSDFKAYALQELETFFENEHIRHQDILADKTGNYSIRVKQNSREAMMTIYAEILKSFKRVYCEKREKELKIDQDFNALQNQEIDIAITVYDKWKDIPNKYKVQK
ncbi:hypothetical protein RyT2_10930 [Pseudolactococcus yaeyamensis]